MPVRHGQRTSADTQDLAGLTFADLRRPSAAEQNVGSMRRRYGCSGGMLLLMNGICPTS